MNEKQLKKEEVLQQFNATIDGSILPSDPIYALLLKKLAHVLNTTPISSPAVQFLTRALAFELKCVAGIGVFILPHRLSFVDMSSLNPAGKALASTSSLTIYDLLQKLIYLSYYRCTKERKISSKIILETLKSFIARMVSNSVYLTTYFYAQKVLTAITEKDDGLMISAMATFTSVILPQYSTALPKDIYQRLVAGWEMCQGKKNRGAIAASSNGSITTDPLDLEECRPLMPSAATQNEIKPQFSPIQTQEVIYFLLLTFYFLIAEYDHSVEQSLSSSKNEYAVSAVLALISFLISFLIYG